MNMAKGSYKFTSLPELNDHSELKEPTAGLSGI